MNTPLPLRAVRENPAPRQQVVVATRSAGKVKELVLLMASVGVLVLTLADLGIPEAPEEDALEVFDTFEENALAKARYFARLTDALVLADDSGLVVDALNGEPGVRSKRWSGRRDLHGAALDSANNAFLQQALMEASIHTASVSRRARYVCAAACVWHDGDLRRNATQEAVARGETAGELLTVGRGENGFGYDPYFLSDDLGTTFAEVGRDAKARVSHRGRAFTALLQHPAVRALFTPEARAFT